MKQLLDVQVDEYTLVLQPNRKPSEIEEWSSAALDIINEFLKLSKVEDFLQELSEVTYSLPKGYTNGYLSEGAPYYFAVSYHPDHIQMGICVKFSAHAWMIYRKEYEALLNQPIHIHQFLKIVDQTSLYSSRLSRIDIAIDFVNEKVSCNTIYNQLFKRKHIIKSSTGRKNHSVLSALTNNGVTSTFYIGSKGKNVKALLRVYDKKKEQIDTNGIRYEEAIYYNDWVRFEAVFKGKYAHELSEKIKKINNETDLKDILVSALTDRYQFYYSKSDKLTTYSKKMMDLLTQRNFSFNSPSPRYNLLEQSQRHIVSGSGLFPYLFKVWRIWGDEGLNKCVSYLHKEFEDYEPNDDVLSWLKKYSALYSKQGLPFK